MYKKSSSSSSLALGRRMQHGMLAAAVLTVSVYGGSASAQRSVSEPVAATNVPAPQGQVGPQAMVTVEAHVPPPPVEGATSRDPLVRGEYVARMGNCVACHTASPDKPFAGGIPFGAVYSSNITPDKETGIGRYTFDDFDKAVRHGVTRTKGSLFASMPYPSYARVSEQDMKDMYAYFMQKVRPVPSKVPGNETAALRKEAAIWRAKFAPDPNKIQARAAAVAPTVDPKVRGAYLVEGLGHCGACHTPRTSDFAEKALTNSDPVYLSGSDQPSRSWIAKSIRGGDATGLLRWSVEDIVALLKTGRNDQSAVFGGMAAVTHLSTQYASDSDLHAMAVYLKSLDDGKPDPNAPSFSAHPATANALWKGDTSQRGSALYLDNCAACHRSDGKGYPQVFPPLAGNSSVLTTDPQNVIAIVLQGHTVPSAATRPSTFTMPAFGWRLTDSQIADVATFVRNSWGNQAPAVTQEQVAKVRKPLGPKAQTIASPSTAP